jgi:hypothetical protein
MAARGRSVQRVLGFALVSGITVPIVLVAMFYALIFIAAFGCPPDAYECPI